MTPTSATRRRADPPVARGFTLLETLVVLALLGLAVALVAPASLRVIAAWQRSTQTEDVLGQLAALPDRARAEARPLVLDDADSLDGLVELPEGWRLAFESPLRVQANGACSGARGELIDEDGVPVPFALEAPYCRIRLPGD